MRRLVLLLGAARKVVHYAVRHERSLRSIDWATVPRRSDVAPAPRGLAGSGRPARRCSRSSLPPARTFAPHRRPGRCRLPPPSRIGSIMRLSSSTRSAGDQRRARAWRCPCTLHVAAGRVAELGHGLDRRRAPGMSVVGAPRQVVLVSVRDTTYFWMAFIWSANGSPARSGHAAAITCQVRRPNSSASVRFGHLAERRAHHLGVEVRHRPAAVAKPPSVSSSAPPGACTTPSRLMNSLMTIRICLSGTVESVVLQIDRPTSLVSRYSSMPCARALDAEPALLDAAERRRRGRRVDVVDADHAEPQPLDHLEARATGCSCRRTTRGRSRCRWPSRSLRRRRRTRSPARPGRRSPRGR